MEAAWIGLLGRGRHADRRRNRLTRTVLLEGRKEAEENMTGVPKNSKSWSRPYMNLITGSEIPGT